MEKCTKCNSLMEIVQQETELLECDIGGMTEGQMADYMGAEMSGDFGDWAVSVVTYKCPKCDEIKITRCI